MRTSNQRILAVAVALIFGAVSTASAAPSRRGNDGHSRPPVSKPSTGKAHKAKPSPNQKKLQPRADYPVTVPKIAKDRRQPGIGNKYQPKADLPIPHPKKAAGNEKAKEKIAKLTNEMKDGKRVDPNLQGNADQVKNNLKNAADKLKDNRKPPIKGSPLTKCDLVTAAPSSDVPVNPKASATGTTTVHSADGLTETKTWTLPDGSKLEETYTRATPSGPWTPTNMYTLTRPDGTSYTYGGHVNGTPLGAWVTKHTPDNPGSVPPGNGGSGPGNGGMAGPWGGSGSGPVNGGMAGLSGGSGSGFDPTNMIGPIISSMGGGGMGGYEAPSGGYESPAPAPRTQLATTSIQPYEPLQEKCDIQKKLTEITGLIAKLVEAQKNIKTDLDKTTVADITQTIGKKLDELDNCGGSNPEIKKVVSELYQLVEKILAQSATESSSMAKVQD